MKEKKYYSINGFPERLKELIYIKNDYNCVSLGREIGVERKTIYSWLNGYTVPNIIQLMKLCKLFKVSADYFIFGEC